MKPQAPEACAAFIGLDGADAKHDICLQAAGSERREFLVLAHSPEAIDAWVQTPRTRFHGHPVAVCLKLHKGPMVSALRQYDCLVLLPGNPFTLARYREAFTPSRAKDDPTQEQDTSIFCDFLRRWPTLKAAQLARRTTLEDLFRAHHVRSADVITTRLEAIKSAVALTTDTGGHTPAIALSVLQQQCRDRRSPDEDTLKSEIAAWKQQRNAEQATIAGRFAVTDARKKLARFYPSLPA